MAAGGSVLARAWVSAESGGGVSPTEAPSASPRSSGGAGRPSGGVSHPGVSVFRVRERVASVIESPNAHIVTRVIVSLNVLLIWCVADDPNFPGAGKLNRCFLAAYILEFSLKLFAFRGTCVFEDDENDHDSSEGPQCPLEMVPWNRFDLVIIVVGIVDEIVHALFHSNDDPASIARAFRVLRVIRLGKIPAVFTPLAKMVVGLAGALPAVLWLFAFMLAVTTLFAIFCASEFGDQAHLYPGEHAKSVEEKWGTSWRAFKTLGAFLTLDGWADMTREVVGPGPNVPLSWERAIGGRSALLTYVVLMSFVILSLLTGTIAEHMLQATKELNEAEARSMLRRLHVDIDSLFEHFSSFCRVHEYLTLPGILAEDFPALLRSPAFTEALSELELDLHIPAEGHADLFYLMDANGDGLLVWDEFRHGLLSMLAGQSSERQRNKLQGQMVYAVHEVVTVARNRPRLHRASHEIDVQVSNVHQELPRISTAVANVSHELDFAIEYFQRHSAFGRHHDIFRGGGR